MRHAVAILFTISALTSSVGRADAARPPARGSSPLAAPVTGPTTGGLDSAGAKYLKTLTPDMQKLLDKEGQVVLGEEKGGEKGSYAGYIKAVAIFHLGKKRVFDLMTDTATQALYLPHITTATVAAKAMNGELTEFVLKFLWSTVKFRVQHWFYPETGRSEWNLDTSVPHDIKAQEGYWQLYELGPDTTVGEYGTRVDTGLAVPAFIQEMFARADIPKAMTAFRKFMDTNGKYRRDGE